MRYEEPVMKRSPAVVRVARGAWAGQEEARSNRGFQGEAKSTVSIFDNGRKMPYSDRRENAPALPRRPDQAGSQTQDGVRLGSAAGGQDDAGALAARSEGRLPQLGRRRAPRAHPAPRTARGETLGFRRDP